MSSTEHGGGLLGKFNRCSMSLLLITGLFSLGTVGTTFAQLDMERYLYAGSGFTGLTGLTLIEVEGETIPFYRMQLAPNFDFGKIGLGLDLVFLYNPDEGVRAEDGEKWDSLNDTLRTIRYVRYGHLREPLYVRYGALDYVTLGYGMLMDGYSNYDRRGLRAQVNARLGGVDVLLNNLAEPDLYGGRLYVRPLTLLEMPLLDRLELGATYLVDTNPNPLQEEAGENLVAYGLDAALPLIQKRQLFMALYDQLGFIRPPTPEAETVSGNAVGLQTHFMGANFKIEYRNLGENFQPVVFDYTYDHRKWAEGWQPYESASVKGLFAHFGYALLGRFLVQAAYEDYAAEGPAGEPRLFGSLVADDVMQKVSLRAVYTKRGIENFADLFDLDEKSAFTVYLGYEFMPPLEVIFVHEFRFRRMDDEDQGYETIHKTSIQLGLNVKF